MNKGLTLANGEFISWGRIENIEKSISEIWTRFGKAKTRFVTVTYLDKEGQRIARAKVTEAIEDYDMFTKMLEKGFSKYKERQSELR